MKKNSLFLFSLIALFLASCKKEFSTSTAGNADSSISPKRSVYVEDNTLVFADENALNDYLDKVTILSSTDLRKHEEDLGFHSQQALFDQMLEDEFVQLEQLYQGKNRELSRDAATNGGTFNHSELFNQLSRQGLIAEKKESDGNYHYELLIQDKLMAYVVNTDGKVRIGDQTRTYTMFSVALSSSNDSQVEVITYDNRDTWSGSTGWITDPYQGSNYRCRLSVTGNSSTNGGTLMTSTYSASYEGEKLVLGTWAKRNNYNPIYSATGTWHYRYILSPNINTVLYDNLPNTVGSKNSGFYYLANSTNYYVPSCHPNGIFSVNSPNGWYAPANVYTYAFHGSMNGGASGWSMNLNH